ncbi:hypothetical protein EIP86_008606 [Pleurotus ostreatoroseus]|nr:hypothetical protein EIP86_008606 [Pleurotus ostreatoroseus]
MAWRPSRHTVDACIPQALLHPLTPSLFTNLEALSNRYYAVLLVPDKGGNKDPMDEIQAATSNLELNEETFGAGSMVRSSLRTTLRHFASPDIDAPAISGPWLNVSAEDEASMLDNGIVLDDDAQVTSFLDFMLADKDRRFPLLSGLSIGQFTPRSRSQQVQLLQHSVNLRRLNIRNASMFQEGTDATVALQALEHLESLTVGFVSASQFLNVLPLMHSHCVEIDIFFGSGWTDSKWNPVPGDLNATLVSSASTLERLRIEESARFGTIGTQYPRVTSLSTTPWNGERESEFVVEPIVYTFPSLKRLIILHHALSRAEPQDPVACRKANQSAALENMWPSLDYLHGPLPQLYALGLRCPVRSLVVNEVLYMRWEIDTLFTMLEANARVCVYLTEGSIYDFFWKTHTGFPQAISHVTLHVNLSGGTPEDIDRIADGLVDFVQSVGSLTFLDVRLLGYNFDPNMCPMVRDRDPIEQYRHIRNIDLEALATRLSQSCLPNLQYILLEAGCEPSSPVLEPEPNVVLVWKAGDGNEDIRQWTRLASSAPERASVIQQEGTDVDAVDVAKRLMQRDLVRYDRPGQDGNPAQNDEYQNESIDDPSVREARANRGIIRFGLKKRPLPQDTITSDIAQIMEV